MNKRIMRYGNDQALPRQIPLRAGPLSLFFEQGDLRTLRFGNREVLRRIYVAIRDRNWGTIPAQISRLRIRAGKDSFRIVFRARNREGDIDFAWDALISGDPQGTVIYSMDGVARSTFLRNRIGFCVLHPLRECVGRPCRVLAADGTVHEGRFPEDISPHQPFKQIRSIAHSVIEGVEATVRFEGEVFEMEDQRNWTDASFKTYCTPLELPFPVRVVEGTRIRQSVALSLQGTEAENKDSTVRSGGPASAWRRVSESPVIVSLGPESASVPLPAIGLEASGTGLNPREAERLKALSLSHLRVSLKLFDVGWKHRLEEACGQAEVLDLPLEIALFLSHRAEAELEKLAELFASSGPRVARWLIFHREEKSTRTRWIDLARRHLGGLRPGAPFGAGTDAYFAELNRERPPVEALDFICYSINPQVHAFDAISLMETLEAQTATVQSAKRFSAGLPIVVTPVTLKPRYNPNATGPEPELNADGLPLQVDRRQMSLFGAAWTAGSLKSLGESGVQSLTYYETVGWRGVMERESGPPRPELFHSIPGAVFPLYHVLADFAEFRGGWIVPTESDKPLAVSGLALRKAETARIILANLTAQKRQVRVIGLRGPLGIRLLDERNGRKAMTDPEAYRREAVESSAIDADLLLTLLPYATACIDAPPAAGRKQSGKKPRR